MPFLKIKKIIFFIFLAEILSFLVWLRPALQWPVFLILCLFALLISLLDLRWGVFLAWLELLISSKGYLFFLNLGGSVISLRLALWLIVLSVWAWPWLARAISRPKSAVRPPDLSWRFVYSPFFAFFSVLFLFIFWGVVNGFLNGHSFNNIFFDANGWLYFALIFPFYSALKTKTDILALWRLFLAAIVWLSLKTLFLLFLFSHGSENVLTVVYRWVRQTGVGEITKMPNGFYRIFFQSHIFVLLGFFIVFFLFCQHWFKAAKSGCWRLKDWNFFFMVLFLAAILVSFSRSFWLGLASGLVLAGFWQLKRHSVAQTLSSLLILLLAGAASLALVAAIVKFPYPRPAVEFSPAAVLAERATKIKNEAAVASRWALWPKLSRAIKVQPVLGQGFGATVTYKSSDPRIRAATLDGTYTTYAFEWGWLDIWLKLGLLGLLAYLALIFSFFAAAGRYFLPPPKKTKFWLKILNLWPKFRFQQNFDHNLIGALMVGLAVLAVVNFFSPYLNHPLGIGYLMAAAVTLDNFKQ